jgi:uncharacterized protein
MGEATVPEHDGGLHRLMARMMAVPLVVIRHVGSGPSEELRRLLPDHLAYMIGLEQQGVLFGSGPLSGADLPPNEGMTILQTVDLAEAERLWADEPFFKAGLRGARFRVWTLNEGGPRFHLTLSTQSLSMAGART